MIKYPWISKLLHNPTNNSFIGGFLQILDYHLLDVNGFNFGFDIGSENQKYSSALDKEVFLTPPTPPQLESCTASIKKKDPCPNR